MHVGSKGSSRLVCACLYVYVCIRGVLKAQSVATRVYPYRGGQRNEHQSKHTIPSSRKEKNSRSARSRSRVESLAFRELSTLHLSLAHERTATDPAKEK